MTEPASPRVRGANPQVLLLLLFACLPGASALVFFFGWGVVFNLAWVPLLALAMEAAVLKLRAQPVGAQLRDCSALVTALLLALALPPAAPWWLGASGAFVAIVLAKHLYGGRHVLNPAMTAYAVLLIAFPLQMTRWLLPEGASPSFTDAALIFFDRDPLMGIDAFTGATALDSFRQEREGRLFAEFMAASPAVGDWAALGWEWINTGFLAGGLYLVYRRVIGWHIPVTVLAALAVWPLLFHDGGSSSSLGSPLFHWFSGATMLGAFFIATDPGTAPATTRGKLVYGVLIGSLVFAFRAWSRYPDGLAFAVLLGNLAAPLIDAALECRAFTLERNWRVTALAAIALSAVLAFGNFIAGLRPQAELSALDAVMPAALHDNDLRSASFVLDPDDANYANLDLLGLDSPRNAYRATLNGQPSGVVLPLQAPEGYSGAIPLLIGIDANGIITGVRAILHRESRGFGDGLDPDVSPWIRGFENRSLANTDEVLWAVKKDGGDFDQFVGATITPRATVNAVHNALLFFEANKNRLLSQQ